MNKKNLFFLSVLIVTVAFFFYPFLLKAKLPVPSDTIIGLYYPFRDLYVKNYQNGIPFKNFLITDPVRQQYPWRKLVIDSEKNMQLPLWNPYSMTGTPLLANFQSAAFYPLNVFLYFLPFNTGWSTLVMTQILLAGVFMYVYLNYLRLNKWACVLGSLCFAFSGFSIAWLEWNTILNTALWLPLLLLSLEHLLRKKTVRWVIVFLFAACCAVFAGHLQTFFYLFLLSSVYLLSKVVQISLKERGFSTRFKVGIKLSIPFFILGIVVFLITAIQLIPTFQFILLSARSLDQVDWQKPGWFIPWAHIVQFVAPDFFGNPTTLNYWGEWNYGEFIGYIGIAPLILSLYSILCRRDKKTLFFASLFFLSILFSFPSLISHLPYILNIPFISTSQPTRLLFVADFSLAVLATLGLDLFIRRKKNIIYPLGLTAGIFLVLWVFVLFGSKLTPELKVENLLVARSNLVFPTGIFALCLFLFSLSVVKNKRVLQAVIILIILVSVFDLMRFANKFTPFTEQKYLFPQTKTTQFLQSRTSLDQSRIMSLDSRIFPPNFSNVYKLQSIEGYDPLYLKRYGEYIIALERNGADIRSPFGFNRIITPHRYNSKLIDLMGVRYLLTFDELKDPEFKKVFEEGQTYVYENTKAFSRVFFVENTLNVKNGEEAMQKMFEESIDLQRTAIIEKGRYIEKEFSVGEVKIEEYSPNRIVLQTKNADEGFLVLTDSFYPIWKAQIDGEQSVIYRADFNFRGVVVPKGEHTVLFYPIIF